MSQLPHRRDFAPAIAAFLGSPRLANAVAVAAIGVAMFATSIEKTIGWAGLIAMVSSLVVLATTSLLLKRKEIEWQGLLPISLLAFVGWAAASIVWSQYQWASLGGIAYLIAFTVLGVYIALMRDTIQIVRAFGDVFRGMLVISIAVEIISGVLIDQPVKFLDVAGNLANLGPIQGLMGSRNQIGLVALLALITFGIEYRTKSVSRWVGIGSAVLAAVALLLSRSPVMFAVFGVVAASAVALYLLRRVRPERRTAWQVVMLAAAAIVAIVAWIFRSRIIELFGANSDLSYRLTLWNRIFDFMAVFNNPLQGWGWVGYWHPETQLFASIAGSEQRAATSAVNAYVDVWFQLGLVGIALFLGLVVLTFSRSWLLAGRQRSVVFTWPALMLVALLFASLAESSMLVEYGWVTFVVCSVKAAQQLSWRTAFAPRLEQAPLDE